jgi:hypothetical protein
MLNGLGLGVLALYRKTSSCLSIAIGGHSIGKVLNACDSFFVFRRHPLVDVFKGLTFSVIGLGLDMGVMSLFLETLCSSLHVTEFIIN